jgi:hypothetical protein
VAGDGVSWSCTGAVGGFCVALPLPCWSATTGSWAGLDAKMCSRVRRNKALVLRFMCF